MPRPGSLQSAPDDQRIGGVEDERRLDRLLESLDGGRHLIALVAPFGEGDADVESVGSALHLTQATPDDAVVVVGEQQLLDLPRPLSVDPLTDEQWLRLLVQSVARMLEASRGAPGRHAKPGSSRPRGGPELRCAPGWCRSSRPPR